jgi:4-amino-4-deoxy-L-arabinose transferase-like glycosyltransferase
VSTPPDASGEAAPEDPAERATGAAMARMGALWVALFALALVALATGTGTTALMDPDEGRNAEVAREMAERGDFVVPHLNGLPYLDKPIFFFAAAAVAVKGLGPTEFAVRLPALAFTIATVALLAGFAYRLFGREVALLAGLALATAPLVLAYARIVIFDGVLLFWVTASCVSFQLAWSQERRLPWVVGWAAAGVATLTKGPVGLVLPLLVNVAYALACRERLRRLFDPLGMLAFAFVVAPWFLAVTARHPEFPHYAFVRETFQRVATDRMARSGPIWYFVPLLVGGALPWALLPLFDARRLPAAWRERTGAGRARVYLQLWVAAPFLLFTLSQSKRAGYILPVFPALALLCALHFHEAPDARRRVGWLTATLAAGAGLVLLVGSDTIAGLIRNAPGLAGALRESGPWLGLYLAATAALTTWASVRRSRTALIAGLALVPIVSVIGARSALEALGEDRSARSLAAEIRADSPSTPRVIGIEAMPHSLAFYLRTPILVSTATAGELRSNYIFDYTEALRDAPGSTLRPLEWWRGELRDCSTPTVFVVRGNRKEYREELAAQLPLLTETRRFAAYGPCASERA